MASRTATHSPGTPATVDAPCPICGATKRCLIGDKRVVCYGQSAGALQAKQDRTGSPYFVHAFPGAHGGNGVAPRGGGGRGRRKAAAGGKPKAKGSPVLPLANADFRHQVYIAFQRAVTLSMNHRLKLHHRGLSHEEIERRGYRSLPMGDHRPDKAAILYRQFGDTLLSVPGFVRKAAKDGGEDVLTIAGRDGIWIPVRDVQGRIVAAKIRVDRPDAGEGKYQAHTSARHGGPSPGSPAHVPLGLAAPAPTVRVTEGELKADIAFALNWLPTISVAGASSWRPALATLCELGTKTVRLAFDADAREKADVAHGLLAFATALQDAGFVVELERWPASAGKGIDDVLAAGNADQIETLTGEAAMEAMKETAAALGVSTNNPTPADSTTPADSSAPGSSADTPADSCGPLPSTTAATPASSPAPAPASPDGRLVVRITTDEHRANDQAAAALAKAENVYQRGGRLVYVVNAATQAKPDVIKRADDAACILRLPKAIVRDRLTRVCLFINDGGATHPPRWLVDALYDWGNCPGVPHLKAVVSFPILRPDGSVLTTPGYDPATELMVQSFGGIDVPDAPTLEDAQAAAERLLDPICDFPFATGEHRAGWLALVLTPLARFAFDGPAPLFLADANVRGSGKTRLIEVAALIVLGTEIPRTPAPKNDEEARKKITSIAMNGDPIVLIDNVSGTLGTAALDAALTGNVWRDRLLGGNEMPTMPLVSTWAASGNNVVLGADTSRRVVHLRLHSPLENPEERADFRHPNLIPHVLANRSELLTAALTILRGYHVAGRPSMGIKPWGSFEGWSNLVRASLVWAGQPDPAGAREELVRRNDREAGALRALVDNFHLLNPGDKGLTAHQIITKLEGNASEHVAIRDAVIELCPTNRHGGLPTTKSLAKKLSSFQNRNIGGKMIERRDGRAGCLEWVVLDINPPPQKDVF